MSIAVRPVLVLVLALTALCACTPSAVAFPSAPPAAATVDGQAITMAAYNERLAVSRARDPYAGIAEDIPSPAPSQRLEDFTIEQLIREAIIEQEALSRHIAITDQQVSTRIRQLRETASGTTFDAALQRNGFTAASFADYERALLAEVALLQSMARERIDSAENELKSGQSFDSVVDKYNDDQGTAARHGELGWIRVADLPEPALRSAVQSMSAGSTSGIIQTDRGFVIAHIMDGSGDRVRLAVILVLAPTVDLFSPQGTPAWFTKVLDDRETALKNDGKISINVGSRPGA